MTVKRWVGVRYLQGAVKARCFGLCAGIQVFSESEWAIAPRVLGRVALVRLCRQQSLEHYSHFTLASVTHSAQDGGVWAARGAQGKNREKRERERERKYTGCFLFIHSRARNPSNFVTLLKLPHNYISLLTDKRFDSRPSEFLWGFVEASINQ